MFWFYFYGWLLFLGMNWKRFLRRIFFLPIHASLNWNIVLGFSLLGCICFARDLLWGSNIGTWNFFLRNLFFARFFKWFLFLDRTLFGNFFFRWLLFDCTFFRLFLFGYTLFRWLLFDDTFFRFTGFGDRVFRVSRCNIFFWAKDLLKCLDFYLMIVLIFQIVEGCLISRFVGVIMIETFFYLSFI